jgi:hypothetical protein
VVSAGAGVTASSPDPREPGRGVIQTK